MLTSAAVSPKWSLVEFLQVLDPHPGVEPVGAPVAMVSGGVDGGGLAVPEHLDIEVGHVGVEGDADLAVFEDLVAAVLVGGIPGAHLPSDGHGHAGDLAGGYLLFLLGHCFSPLSGANSRGLGAGLVHAIPFFPVEWRWHSWSFSLQLPPGGGISCKSVGQVGLMETVEGSAAPHLRSATLHNVHPFSSKVVFRFDPKVNVLIGPNGVGKSAALNRFAGVGRRRLSPASDDWEVRVDGVMGPEGASLGDVETVYVGPTRAPLTPEMVLGDLELLNVQGRVATLLTLLRRAFWLAMALSAACLLSVVMAGLFLAPPIEWFGFGLEGLVAVYALFLAMYLFYLLTLFLRRSPLLLAFLPGNWLLSNVLTHRAGVSPIFMFQAVLSANRRWLSPGTSPFTKRRSCAAYAAAELALDCAKEIAPEVFPKSAELGTGTIESVVRNRWLGWRWRRSFTDRLSTVHTRFSPEPLHITTLSAGTQNTLLIAWYISLRLAYSNEFEEGWKDLPAILFIDEIENHLHPAWQRRFIPVFLKHFPNLQVIATTHSPFHISGLKAGQVHRLSQDDDWVTWVETNDEDIIGFTADEILHDYLEVLDPTDLETAEAVELLRWLDGLEPLVEEESAESWRSEVVEELSVLEQGDELAYEEALVARWLSGQVSSPVAVDLPLEGEAEAWRLSVMAKFRSQLGVDILSGGPAARQRKIWEEQMERGTFPVLGYASDDEWAGG